MFTTITTSSPTNLTTQFPPFLAHHLTDASLTPVLSSSISPSQPQNQQQQQQQAPSQSSSISPSNTTHNHNPSPTRQQQNQQQLNALTALTSAALSTYTTASRLHLGSVRRVMIETNDKGPIVLHSFIRPEVAARSTSRGNRGTSRTVSRQEVGSRDTERLDLQRGIDTVDADDDEATATEGADSSAEAQLHASTAHSTGTNGTATPIADFHNITLPNGGDLLLIPGSKKGKRKDVNGIDGQETEESDTEIEPEGDEDEEEEEEDDLTTTPAGGPPMLVGTVVAPSAERSVASAARRAASRLEVVGREFQRRWGGRRLVGRFGDEEERERGDGDGDGRLVLG